MKTRKGRRPLPPPAGHAVRLIVSVYLALACGIALTLVSVGHQCDTGGAFGVLGTAYHCRAIIPEETPPEQPDATHWMLWPPADRPPAPPGR